MSEKIKQYWWMDISDKIKFEDEEAEDRFCPPHYIPHKLPFGEKIATEPCHTHISVWRRSHHNFFCEVLKCENCEFMREKTEEILKSKK